MALGARPGDVLALVVRESFRLTVLGMAIGALGAYCVARLMSKLLYGFVSPDVLIFSGASIFLACAALVASYIPARSAARLDPNVALRGE
jgi:putative ABC transport system permease protein